MIRHTPMHQRGRPGAYLKWYAGIVGEFTRLKPQCSVLMVIFSLIAQVLTLLIFIVPIKLLFAIGLPSREPAKVFTIVWSDRGELALFSIALIALIIVGSMLIDKLAAAREKSCSRDIWKRNQKLTVYANQEDVAARLYRRYIESMSGFLLFFLITVGLLIYYTPVALTLLLFWSAAAFALTTGYNMSRPVRHLIDSQFGKVLNRIGLLGFAVVFSVIVAELFYLRENVNIIVAVVSLILTRHIVGNIATAVVGVKALHDDKERVETIFFERQAAHTRPAAKQSALWPMLEPGVRHGWMEEAIEKASGRQTSVTASQWFELGRPNEYAFTVETIVAEMNEAQRCFVKIFDKNALSNAERETALLQASFLEECTLAFIGSVMIGAFRCNVFEQTPVAPFERKAFHAGRQAFMVRNLHRKVPQNLIDLYIGTHLLVHERVGPEAIDKMRIAVDDEGEKVVQAFDAAREGMAERIAALPLRLHLASVSSDTLQQAPDGAPKLLCLGQWQIEPMGYGLSMGVAREQLEQTKDVDMGAVELVVLYGELERLLKQYRFYAAVDIMRTMLETAEAKAPTG